MTMVLKLTLCSCLLSAPGIFGAQAPSMEPPYNSERGARSLEGRGRQGRNQQQVSYDNYDDDILDSYGGEGEVHHQIEERQATYNSGKGGGEALMPYRWEQFFHMEISQEKSPKIIFSRGL